MRGSRHGRPLAALLVCGAVLSACRGDGGPSRPGSRIAEAGPKPRPPAVGSPDMEAGPASVWAAAVLGAADALFATSVHEERGFGAREVHDSGCSGLGCSRSDRGAIGIASAAGLAGAGVVGRAGGIDMVSASDLDAASWGGWMRHAGFGVLLEREGMGADLRERRYGLAAGDLSTVSEGVPVRGTWRGRMTGVAAGGDFGDSRLQGAAELTYVSTGAVGNDAEDGDIVGRIDAAFTGIVSVETDTSFPDAGFEDVPVSLRDVVKLTRDETPDDPLVTARMAFDAGVAGNRIRGGFFGPARDEVAGVFEQNGILGAFGAVSGSGSNAPGPGTAAPAGRVRVIDGDTVDIDGVRWRLHGIDAPESGQSCRAWGRTWDCGTAATEALMSRAAGMSCSGSETDQYGRSIGVCSSGGIDLNAWLVANGLALAYRQYSEDYTDEEDEARANRRGMHRGEHVAPWNWRRGEQLGGSDSFASSAPPAFDAGALAERLARGDGSGFRGSLLEDSVFGLADGTTAVSFGAWPETNPGGTGGAVWRGSMVGAEGARRIEGDAEIAIDDLAAPDVDIALTGMTATGGAAVADMRWEDISVAQGAFRTSGTNGSIEGRFYGAGHGEAGGVFERNGIAGAFGATRE